MGNLAVVQCAPMGTKKTQIPDVYMPRSYAWGETNLPRSLHYSTYQPKLPNKSVHPSMMTTEKPLTTRKTKQRPPQMDYGTPQLFLSPGWGPMG